MIDFEAYTPGEKVKAYSELKQAIENNLGVKNYQNQNEKMKNLFFTKRKKDTTLCTEIKNLQGF